MTNQKKLQKTILLEKKNAYTEHLKKRLELRDQISSKMKNFSNGIKASIIDTRTSREKQSDRNYIYQTQRATVYKIFNNDQEMAEEYLTILGNSEVLPQEFSIVSNALESAFKNKIIEPWEVFETTRKYIQNYNETGTVTGQSMMGSVRGSVYNNNTHNNEHENTKADDNNDDDNDDNDNNDDVDDKPDDVSALTFRNPQNKVHFVQNVHNILDKHEVPKKLADEISEVLATAEDLMPEFEEEELRDDVSILLERLDNIIATKSLKEHTTDIEINRIIKLSVPQFRALLNNLSNGKHSPIGILEQIIDVIDNLYANMQTVQTNTIEKEEVMAEEKAEAKRAKVEKKIDLDDTKKLLKLSDAEEKAEAKKNKDEAKEVLGVVDGLVNAVVAKEKAEVKAIRDEAKALVAKEKANVKAIKDEAKEVVVNEKAEAKAEAKAIKDEAKVVVAKEKAEAKAEAKAIKDEVKAVKNAEAEAKQTAKAILAETKKTNLTSELKRLRKRTDYETSLFENYTNESPGQFCETCNTYFIKGQKRPHDTSKFHIKNLTTAQKK